MKNERVSKELFFDNFGDAATETMFSHGRLEILGNHTDHNHGLSLVAAASIGITATFAKRDDGFIRFKSDGYPMIDLDLSDLEIREQEKGTSAGIVRGVCRRMKELGYNIGKGFSAAAASDIFPGAGVSSSACFESLIVGILSHLYNEDKVSPLEMAKIGQYAENVYFGKPCGILDQIGTSFGGLCYVDFKDPNNPVVEPLPFPFHFDVVLINTGGSHANLTPYYASIPQDMKEVAQAVFGKEYLREVNPSDFMAGIARPTVGVSERAKLRAQHFFDENLRVLSARKAIFDNDPLSFLDAVIKSQFSSKVFLANTMVPDQYAGSPQECVDLASPYAEGGAVRIMGGGFAGSCIAFIPRNATARFITKMEKVYGRGNVLKMEMPEGGPRVI
ncbi:MAG: galactokinase [Bacilli bacterium]|nr:galactokinase [Bacilli bacterium]